MISSETLSIDTFETKTVIKNQSVESIRYLMIIRRKVWMNEIYGFGSQLYHTHKNNKIFYLYRTRQKYLQYSKMSPV